MVKCNWINSQEVTDFIPADNPGNDSKNYDNNMIDKWLTTRIKPLFLKISTEFERLKSTVKK
jgi:hypothetical protein